MNAPDSVMIFGSYSWKLDDTTWVINFMNGSQNMYLLEGDNKALLIDTGWGAGNVKSYVEKLTDKPIEVINTHFHPDHSGSNGEFEWVYVSKNWEKDSHSLVDCPFDLSALPYVDYEKRIVGTGDIIDLGGRKIAIYDAKPAHCESTLFLWDCQRGMYFIGDDFESTQTIFHDGEMSEASAYDVRQRLNNLRDNALSIKEKKDEIRFLLPNHNGAPIAMSYIDDYIGLVEHIFAGDAVVEDKLNHFFIEQSPLAPYLCRVRWNHCSIIAKKADIVKVYGQ